MNLDLISIFLIVCFLLWIVSHLIERRRIVNGLLFFMSMGSLLFLIMYIGIRDDIRALTFIGALISMAIILLIPILMVVSVYILFSTGIELIKKEGMSLAHGLSFLFGLGVIGSSILAPFLINKIDSKLLTIIIEFFLGCFTYFSLGFIVYLSSSIIYNFYIEKKNKDYLIVLGSGLNKDKVTPLLAGRIDKAIDFYKRQLENKKRAKLVMSGGQGKDELVPEGLAMKNYALEKGVREEDILVEDRSRSTEENLSYSMEIIKKDTSKTNPKVLFFTSNYHVFRAGLISKKLGFNINGRGSTVKLYFYISAIIREYIAILYMHKKFNIFIITLILLVNLLKGF